MIKIAMRHWSGDPGARTTRPPHMRVLFSSGISSNHQYFGSSAWAKKTKSTKEH
jgi:hypothetical protein